MEGLNADEACARDKSFRLPRSSGLDHRQRITAQEGKRAGFRRHSKRPDTPQPCCHRVDGSVHLADMELPTEHEGQPART
ncbi:hypothetical protein FQZ97_1266080 [compost metagenome]